MSDLEKDFKTSKEINRLLANANADLQAEISRLKAKLDKAESALRTVPGASDAIIDYLADLKIENNNQTK